MAKQVVKSDKLYPVCGPYSHAVRAGDMVFLHGTVGVDAHGRLLGSTAGRTDMAAQCAQTLENMHTALELFGRKLAGRGAGAGFPAPTLPTGGARSAVFL
jgi:enamine deaminase RidA (YjgF/YER057c/UK114 family)